MTVFQLMLLFINVVASGETCSVVWLLLVCVQQSACQPQWLHGHNRQLAIFTSTSSLTKSDEGLCRSHQSGASAPCGGAHILSSVLAENFVNVCGIGRQLTQGNACAKGFFFHRRVCRFMGFFDSLARQIDVGTCRFLNLSQLSLGQTVSWFVFP